jgi:hypothetical protein
MNKCTYGPDAVTGRVERTVVEDWQNIEEWNS